MEEHFAVEIDVDWPMIAEEKSVKWEDS